MRINDQEVKFNIFKAIKFPNDMEECYLVKKANEVVGDDSLSDHGSKISVCDDIHEKKETIEWKGDSLKHCWGCTTDSKDIPNTPAKPEYELKKSG